VIGCSCTSRQITSNSDQADSADQVAIARAILKNPKIILLDEATSMIDMETERQIQEAFKKLAKDRTMFVVA
jgi:ABC-type multidrug transport system fused ATPase/permease subunit